MSEPPERKQTSATAQTASKRIFTAPQLEGMMQELSSLAQQIGFEQVGIASIDLHKDADRFKQWLHQGFHADMTYLAKHGEKRFRPELLIPGTLSIICVRLNYLFPGLESLKVLKDPTKAYISRYALGRDYHKVMRNKLKKLAQQLQQAWKPFGYRVFTDSAPVLEKPLAQQAGLGWMGKHTLILDKNAGSWFFLGEIYTDLPLPQSEPLSPSCGKCKACITVCPTQAIVAPYQLDANRCISYLTIENKGPIPKTLRPMIGNRIFGCDDCQLVCPWNRWAQPTQEADFTPRGILAAPDIVALLHWDQEQFLKNTEGSPIRRTGYWGWLRNLAVAAENAPGSATLAQALAEKIKEVSRINSKSQTEEASRDTAPEDWLLAHLKEAHQQQKDKLSSLK